MFSFGYAFQMSKLAGGVSAFDHHNTTHRFGIKLREDDVTCLTSVLNDFLEAQPRRLE